MEIRQPDLHYEGPLTAEAVGEIQKRLEACFEEVKTMPAVCPQCGEICEGWLTCVRNWHNTLRYACLRLVAIKINLEYGLEAEGGRWPDVHKCLDISLCIERDYKEAKAKNFIDTSHAEA